MDEAMTLQMVSLSIELKTTGNDIAHNTRLIQKAVWVLRNNDLLLFELILLVLLYASIFVSEYRRGQMPNIQNPLMLLQSELSISLFFCKVDVVILQCCCSVPLCILELVYFPARQLIAE